MLLFTRWQSTRQLLTALTFLLILASSSFAQNTTTAPADETTSATPGERYGNFGWDNRPSVRYGDLLRIDVRARLTSDMRRPDAALTGSDTSRFDIARRRIGVEGEIADVADFQIEREFADGDGRAW